MFFGALNAPRDLQTMIEYGLCRTIDWEILKVEKKHGREKKLK